MAAEESAVNTTNVRDGHVFIHVNDLARAVRFYKDILGIAIQRTTRDWVDLVPKLGLSLSQGDEEFVEFHVNDIEEAISRLKKLGVKVERKSNHRARISDPFGNTFGIHDHRH